MHHINAFIKAHAFSAPEWVHPMYAMQYFCMLLYMLAIYL